MKLGQTEVVSLVLISGIVIGLVGTAYFWGAPLIEKRTAANDFSLFQKFAKDIDNRIASLANSKTGTEKIRIPNGVVRVVPYDAVSPDNNSIIVEFPLNQKLLLGDNTIFYQTSNIGPAGVFGEDEPRIISFTQRPDGTRYVFTMKIQYRELLINTPPKKGFVIALSPGESASSGTTEITLSYKGFRTSGTASNGGNLILTEISATAV